MNYSVLAKCSLFKGLPASKIQTLLEDIPHRIVRFDKEETVFHLMDPANRIGIILEGRVEAQKSFPNGSRINVSVRRPGDLIGPAAVFSQSPKYPCDMVALDPAEIMMLQKNDLLALLARDGQILSNFISQIATATSMLQQRLELLSYSGIAQKAAFYLLSRARETGKNTVPIPGTMTNWALIMNVSRPSLHRELRRMEENEMIALSGRLVKIMDADALAELLG